jgi:quinol-cytochrome oxidoreductase complex cytochrome b subunit
MKEKFAALLQPNDIDNLPTDSASDIFINGLNLVYYVTGIVAVVVIIIAGIMYITSAGDQNSITRAKNMLLYAIVGLVVIVLAFTITQFVIGRF